MSPLYDFINIQYQVWDPCIFVDTAALDVTEIWTNPTSGRRAVENKQLPTLDVDSWLKQTATTIDGAEYSLVLRLVWIKFQHVEKIKHISPTVLDRPLAHSGIQIAHRWNWSCFAGSTRFEQESGDGPLYSYAVCNHPKAAAAWSYSPAQGITQGIYFAGPSQFPELQGLVRSLVGTAYHAMLPALVFGISLSGLIETEHKSIKENVRAVEVRTRFHSWTSRNEAPAQGDYISLWSATTGAKTRLANLLRRTNIVHELCEFIYDNLQPPSNNGSHVGNPLQLSRSDPVRLIVEYTRVLYKRTVLQAADVQFFQNRADAQVAAVSNSRPSLLHLHSLMTVSCIALHQDSTRPSCHEHQYCECNAAGFIVAQDSLAGHDVLPSRDISCDSVFCAHFELG